MGGRVTRGWYLLRNTFHLSSDRKHRCACAFLLALAIAILELREGMTDSNGSFLYACLRNAYSTPVCDYSNQPHREHDDLRYIRSIILLSLHLHARCLGLCIWSDQPAEGEELSTSQ